VRCRSFGSSASRRRSKSADCTPTKVDAAGVGTYQCTIRFLAVKDSGKFTVEVNAKGVWSAQEQVEGQ
jgi:hypothetical protein